MDDHTIKIRIKHCKKVLDGRISQFNIFNCDVKTMDRYLLLNRLQEEIFEWSQILAATEGELYWKN